MLNLWPMQSSLGTFRAAVLTGWIVLSVAAFLYARMKNIPPWAAIPIAAAFLIEYPFYLAPGFSSVRARLRAIDRTRLSVYLVVSGLIPWLAYSVPAGQFHVSSLAGLVAILTLVSFWYVVFPGVVAADIGFILVLAAIVLGKFLTQIY